MKKYNVAFTLLLAGLLPTLSVKGSGANTNAVPLRVLTTWKENTDNVQNRDIRQKIQTRLNHIVEFVNDVSFHKRDTGNTRRVQALNADVERVATGKVSRCTMFDPHTDRPRRLEFRVFDDELRRMEDNRRSYDLDFAHEGMPVLFRQRDGKETLAFYPSGALKTYLLNVEGDHWYAVQWNDRGEVVSEKAGRNTSIIGTVQTRK